MSDPGKLWEDGILAPAIETNAFNAAWSAVAIFLVAMTILYFVPEIVTLIPNYIAAQK